MFGDGNSSRFLSGWRRLISGKQNNTYDIDGTIAEIMEPNEYICKRLAATLRERRWQGDQWKIHAQELLDTISDTDVYRKHRRIKQWKWKNLDGPYVSQQFKLSERLAEWSTFESDLEFFQSLPLKVQKIVLADMYYTQRGFENYQRPRLDGEAVKAVEMIETNWRIWMQCHGYDGAAWPDEQTGEWKSRSRVKMVDLNANRIYDSGPLESSSGNLIQEVEWVVVLLDRPVTLQDEWTWLAPVNLYDDTSDYVQYVHFGDWWGLSKCTKDWVSYITVRRWQWNTKEEIDFSMDLIEQQRIDQLRTNMQLHSSIRYLAAKAAEL